MKIIYTLLFMFVLSGCSSTPTPIQNAKVIQADRVFEIEPLNDKSEYATLKILRDSGLNGANQDFEVWLNGELGAKLRTEELYEVRLNPGANFIEIRMYNVLGKISPAQVETIFKKDGIYVYRTGFNANAGILTLTRDISLSR